MVVHNPNNWHWVDKNCLPWAKEYLETNVQGISDGSGEYTLTVTSVDSVTGDCDVTQRKGKVLCIYDMALDFTVTAKPEEGDEVTARISLPEFVHDQDEDEYQFSTSGDAATDTKKYLLPLVLAQLQKFQQDLIDAHSQDVQHATD
ncbi:hsp90 co-chaperone Hch1p [Diutina catenulata]